MKEQIKKAVSLGLTVITAGSIITYTVSTKSEAASGLTVLFKNSSDNSVKVVNGYQIKEDLSGVYIQAPGAVEFVKTDIGGRILYSYENSIYYRAKFDIQCYDLESGKITTVKSFNDYNDIDVEGANGNCFIISRDKSNSSFTDNDVCTLNIKTKKLSKIKGDYMDGNDNWIVTRKDSFSNDRTLYKVTDKGFKKVKVLSNTGYHSVYFGNKKIFYFVKNEKKKTLSFMSCNLNGKKTKTLKTFKFPDGMFGIGSSGNKSSDYITITIKNQEYKLIKNKDKIVKVK